MPQGTYLQTRGQSKTSHQALHSKAKVSEAKRSDLEDFYSAVSRLSSAKVDAQHRYMARLVDDLKKDEILSKDDKIRKRVSEVLGEVRKVLETAKDYKQLEGRLQLPVYPVMQAPPSLNSSEFGIGLAIALCQVLEVFVRLLRSQK
jgi:hypothetical protein